MKLLFTSLLVSSIMASTVNPNALKPCIRPETIYEQMHQRTVQIIVFFNNGTSASGSGLLAEDGSVITSTHVIHDSASIIVISGEKRLNYSLFKEGEKKSISILHPVKEHKSHKGHKVKFRPATSVSEGELVYSMGYPFGGKQIFVGGYVAANLNGVIALSMQAYPGMSGSPVFDCEGSVIGFIFGGLKNGSITIINPYEDVDEIN